MEQVQVSQHPQAQVSIETVINQALSVQADATTQMRVLTNILAQMATEIQRLTKENNDLKQAKA